MSAGEPPLPRPLPELPLPELPLLELPLLELRGIGKRYGSVTALTGVSARVRAGQVTCVLGDNGAGKSTLIKILAGVHPPDDGAYLIGGAPARLAGPRDARAAGIATVHQDLAMVPLMSVWRNFFLGAEPRRGIWLDRRAARRTAGEALAGLGVHLRDLEAPVGTLSGGERQAVAIARAVHFGAKVLILDEPTSALGVKQAGVVLGRVVQARERGLGVILVTHNPHHAYAVGDHFVVLDRGRVVADHPKRDIGRDRLIELMAGGAELESLGRFRAAGTEE